MAVPTKITDHATQARARLLDEFKKSPNIIALVNALAQQTQEYEDAVHPLLDLLDIDIATGDNLDKIGELVNERRDGASDANYRIAIRGKIAVIIGSGTPDEVIDLFKSITGSTTVALIEWEPAAYGLYGDAASYPASTIDQLDAASVGGVQVAELARWQQEGSSDLILWEDSSTAYLQIRSNSGG